MGMGYQKFQAGSPDGYLDFGVISTPGDHTKQFFSMLSSSTTHQ